MLEYPVAVKDLMEYLPHRPPMVWVDEVVSADAVEGVCRIHLSKEAGYMGPGGVRASSAVEWMAQAYAYTRVCYARSAGAPGQKNLSKAYLVGIRQLEFTSTKIPTEGSLIVRVKTVRDLEGLTLLSGRVETSDGQLLASGTLKVFSQKVGL